MDIPETESRRMLFSTGPSKSLIGGLVGPYYRPQSRTFSAFILIDAGRLKIVRKTGHKLHVDDLNKGTPSVFIESAKFSFLEKKRSSSE